MHWDLYPVFLAFYSKKCKDDAGHAHNVCAAHLCLPLNRNFIPSNLTDHDDIKGRKSMLQAGHNPNQLIE